MSARNKHKPATAGSSLDPVLASIADLLRDAVTFVAADRIQQTVRSLRPGPQAMGDALALATDLVLFTPSFSGQTAFDRLAKQRRDLASEARTALDVVRRASFRLLRIEAAPQLGARDL